MMNIIREFRKFREYIITISVYFMSFLLVFVKMRSGLVRSRLRWTSPDFLGLLLVFVEIMPDKVILDLSDKVILVILDILLMLSGMCNAF